MKSAIEIARSLKPVHLAFDRSTGVWVCLYIWPHPIDGTVCYGVGWGADAHGARDCALSHVIEQLSISLAAAD